MCYHVVMKLADPSTRFMLHRMAGLAAAAREKAWAHTPNADDLKRRAVQARDRVLNDLASHLARLERVAQAHGVQVMHAQSAQEANRLIIETLKSFNAAETLRNRHPLLDEIQLDEAARINAVRLTPLQAGDFLAQLTERHSGHPIWPVGHLTAERISDALNEKWRVPKTYDPDHLASTVRRRLRRQLLRVDAAVLGVHFATTDEGLFTFLDNDGHNASLVSLARHVILLLSIEHVAANSADVEALTRVFALSAWGRPLPAYITQLQKPAPPGTDGPRTLHLILVDHRRREIIAQGFGEALRCIHCGACHTLCPVYQQIGGAGYAHSPYTGPIGATLNPLLLAPELGEPQVGLCDASGQCMTACPLAIDFARLRRAHCYRLAKAGRAGKDRRYFALWRYLIDFPRLFIAFLRRNAPQPRKGKSLR